MGESLVVDGDGLIEFPKSLMGFSQKKIELIRNL